MSSMVDDKHTPEIDTKRSDTECRVSRRDVLSATGAGLLAGTAGCTEFRQQVAPEFELLETSVGEIHSAMADGEVTSEELTSRYLSRIEAYDDAINSVIYVNESAPDRARELDEQFAREGRSGPLHGIPLVLKDIVNTADMPTTAGNVLFEDVVPPEDAHITAQFRNAGAVIIAKVNCGEFASGSLSSLGGQTRNPYDTDRDPSGSSTGTGASIAANLATIGVGTETWGSILGPSTANSIVGIQPTTGLISRDGITPLSETLDSAGPMTRNVADAARMLDVMVGYDPDDPATAECVDEIPEESYTEFLVEDGLEGARLGIPRELIQDDPEETGIEVGQPLQVAELFEAAVEAMSERGATIVDPVEVPETVRELAPEIGIPIITNEFKRDLNDYLNNLGEAAPVEDMREIAESDTIEGSIEGLFESAVEVDTSELDENAEYLRALRNQEVLREGVLTMFSDNDLDALVYPTDNRTPELIDGEREIPDGISPSARTLSPIPNLPSITVPAGYTEDPALPVGLSFLGRQYTEPGLIELAYSYEQATMLREPPDGFGPL
jgi:amidase